MPMTRDEMSELVAGKVVLKEIPPTAVNPDHLISPYREIVKYVQQNQQAELDDLVMEMGHYAVERSVRLAEEIKLPADWPHMMREVAIMDEVGGFLESQAKKLKRGQRVDPAQIMSYARSLANQESVVVKGNEVKPATDPFLQTHWQPWDMAIGGFPKASLTVIGAPPGTGKTSLLIKLAQKAAMAGKKSMIFSMEMSNSQFMNRNNQTEELTDEEKSRFHLCDEILSPQDVASVATMIPDADDLHFIGLDFTELMFTNGYEKNEAVMGNAYSTLARTAKELDTPFVVLSQLSRAYSGGLPQINHLRYTGMAEALASLIVLIYNKSAIHVAQSSDGVLPDVRGKAYLIVGKSRYGNKAKQGGKFAIQVDWNGKDGWGDNGTIHPM